MRPKYALLPAYANTTNSFLQQSWPCARDLAEQCRFRSICEPARDKTQRFVWWPLLSPATREVQHGLWPILISTIHEWRHDPSSPHEQDSSRHFPKLLSFARFAPPLPEQGGNPA